MLETGERIYPKHVYCSLGAYLEYLRHLFAYEWAKTLLMREHRVIEVGCGDGYGTAYLAPHVQQIIGVDIQTDVIEQAREKYRLIGCDFQVYDGTRLPWASGTFDTVVSFQVIEHVLDVNAYLVELRRVLRSGGSALFTTPNATYRLKPGQRPWNRFHLREYRPEELRQVVGYVFSEVQVYGIRGTDQIQALEHARIQHILRMVAYDFLNLRQCLPASWIKRWAAWLQQLLNRQKSDTSRGQNMFTQYNLEDFSLCTTAIHESLDLAAVCRA